MTIRNLNIISLLCFALLLAGCIEEEQNTGTNQNGAQYISGPDTDIAADRPGFALQPGLESDAGVSESDDVDHGGDAASDSDSGSVDDDSDNSEPDVDDGSDPSDGGDGAEDDADSGSDDESDGVDDSGAGEEGAGESDPEGESDSEDNSSDPGTDGDVTDGDAGAGESNEPESDSGEDNGDPDTGAEGDDASTESEPDDGSDTSTGEPTQDETDPGVDDGEQESGEQGNLTGGSDFFPFDQAPRSVLAASNKKVFAHYFTPYPVSISNRVVEDGYYREHYLNPYGENGKFLSKGGLLRQKPLDRAPIPNYESYFTTDLRQEVRLAADMGIDGFAIDILSYSGYNWDRTINLLNVAAQEDPTFKILLMPDMISLGDNSGFVDLIRRLADKPAAYHLPDGRLLVAPYFAERQSPAWWMQQVETLRTYGIDIALLPVYQGWRADLQNFINAFPDTYQDVLYGVSDWGPRAPISAANLVHDPAAAHSMGVSWMAPVAPQDMRPKSSKYTEAENSLTMRNMWMSAINGGADMVQIITWNDYSEATEVSPSTGTGYGFYDLAAYYTQWFKLGEPEIVRDALYAFYREHHTDTPLRADAVQSDLMQAVHGGDPVNQIELLAFLTEPGTLEIEVGGYVRQQHAEAGIVSFKVPTVNGTPMFRLIRDGQVVQSMKGVVDITSDIQRQNMLYYGQSSRRLPAAPSMVSWPWRVGTYGGSQTLLNANTKSPFAAISNYQAIAYTDREGDGSRGFGYSFVAPTPGSVVHIQYDVQIQSGTSGGVEFNAYLADASGNRGAQISLSGDAASGITFGNRSDGSLDLITPVAVATNRWYRVEILIDSATAYQDFDITISDVSGVVGQATNLPFDSALGGLGQLIFSSVRNDNGNASLIVDNVQVVAQ